MEDLAWHDGIRRLSIANTNCINKVDVHRGHEESEGFGEYEEDGCWKGKVGDHRHFHSRGTLLPHQRWLWALVAPVIFSRCLEVQSPKFILLGSRFQEFVYQL